MAIQHVGIVGAGFSGTLQAINLLRHDGPRATLIERGGRAGEGLAYGAAHPSHVLNVRAGNMSAFPDDPAHFVRWLEGRGVKDAATTFASRVTYGEYLREMLDRAIATSGGRLSVRYGEVVDAMPRGAGVALALADGTVFDADAAVLAVGNLPPHDPPGLTADSLPDDLYKGDPWASDLADGLTPDDIVVVIGTGLTMIDVALMLEAKGFAGRIVAISRRGLLPRRHEGAGEWARIEDRPATVASALVRCVRHRAKAIGWRHAVDELRPFTQPMWANASEAERARFLRHLRPWWDVHRHRLAPQVADRLEAMQASRRLQVVAGKTLAFTPKDGGVEMVWRPRGADRPQTLRARRIVNCTGPLGDLSRTTDPLLSALRGRGAIRPDAAHLGIDVNGVGQVIGADGSPSERLYAIGPMTRGAFWEIVAVPDIRRQTWDVARRLSNAQWVGGEGL
ncbi:FAD/NAD(P)-binding protein [Sphingomonas turrisvirgatae]|uniref:FAD-dependent oxidoreductase n=1 Tax=Sphingomonas turrisvirgatae TaxID=1888892 RepID=A0A1E3M0B9_9SPHN|nr:FAD/NAD(P)-binding protein [Sphingomonas turrisvirgatae]ODP39433.1 FAD-dependent oxidoreductase [Sphingomonas turrisvirgatae]